MLLGRALARKLERLADGVAWYARGDLSHRMPEAHRRGDEVNELIRQFNDMGERLEAQQRGSRPPSRSPRGNRSRARWPTTSKNPLTAIRLSIARMGRAGELVEALEGELSTLLRMTESFAEFARLPAPVSRPVELRELLEEVCALYGEGDGVGVELVPGPPVRASGDDDQLRRAFGNLIKNALEACPADGPPVRAELELDGSEVIVAITDSGSGIPGPLEGRQLVRTLGSTKPGGSGLGLPIASKIIHDHAGALRLEPAPTGGTRAVVRLPRVQDKP